MKKRMVIISMVLIGTLAGSRVMAQTGGDKRVPVRTSDPQPVVPRATIALPVKSGGAAVKAINPAIPGSQAESTRLPMKPGSAGGPGIPGGNKTIPAGHPTEGTTAKGPGGVSLPPLKPAGSGSGAIRN